MPIKTEALEKLHELKEKGIITQKEFNIPEEKLLSDNKSVLEDLDINIDFEDEQTQRWYNTPIHFSALLFTPIPIAAYILPPIAMVIPLVLWLPRKDKNETTNQHGKVVVDWCNTLFILLVVSYLFKAVLIAYFFYWVLSAVNLIFGLVGSYEAWNGKFWRYPGSFSIFKV